MATEVYVDRSGAISRLIVGTHETVEVKSADAVLLAAMVAISRSRPPKPGDPIEQPTLPG